MTGPSNTFISDSLRLVSGTKVWGYDLAVVRGSLSPGQCLDLFDFFLVRYLLERASGLLDGTLLPQEEQDRIAVESVATRTPMVVGRISDWGTELVAALLTYVQVCADYLGDEPMWDAFMTLVDLENRLQENRVS